MSKERDPVASNTRDIGGFRSEAVSAKSKRTSTPKPLHNEELEARFTRVFATNLWQDPESISGPGSRIDSDMVTETLSVLRFICSKFSISTLIDIPCGDLNWIPKFLQEFPTIRYFGFDIVKPLIERNKEIHPNVSCNVLDITSQIPPKADLVLCKDLIIHLDDYDIKRTLDNIKRSGSKYLLATNNFGIPNSNLMENIHGDSACRYVDVIGTPFSYPEPIWRTDYLGLWDLDSVPFFEEPEYLTSQSDLVRIAELYIYVNRQDWSFGHLMSDPRSQVVKPSEVTPLWIKNELAPAPLWTAGMKGLPCLAWASLHLFQCGIDFDFFDIGANLGIEGMAQAVLYKKCGWSNKVYLFEPGDIYRLLKASVVCNRISDVATVINAALTDVNGTEKFYFIPNASGGSSLLAKKISDLKTDIGTEVMDVEALTVDSFVLKYARYTPALIIRIDTEGADFKVLDGMRETLKERMIVAQIEFIPDLIETYTSPANRLADLMKDFVLINVGHEQQRHIIPINGIEGFIEKARQSTVPPDILLIPRRLPNAATLLENVLSG